MRRRRVLPAWPGSWLPVLGCSLCLWASLGLTARGADVSLPVLVTDAPASVHRTILQNTADGAKPGDTIDLGGQSVSLDRPVFVPDKIGLKNGEIHVPFGRHHAALYLGIPRAPMGRRLDPARHWFDLPGGRHGLRTAGDGFAGFVAASSLPLTYGMERARQLTVEWSEDYSIAPPDGKGRGILGCQDHGRAYPVYIVQDNTDKYVVAFRVHGGAQHALTFLPPTDAIDHDFAVQIDLPTATVVVFIDGIQAPFAWWYHESPLGPDDALCDNEQIPFKINGANGQGNSPGSDFFDIRGAALALRGMRVSNAARYGAGKGGDEQARLDGRPITDGNRYYDVDGSTLGLLPLTDDPPDAATDRHVTILSPQGVGMGLYLQADHATPYSAQGGNTLENLMVQVDGNQMTPYGTAVVLGYELEFTARRCKFYGGAVGLGSWRWGASYVTRLYECRFMGTMASIYNYYQIIEAYNSVIDSHGRHTFWADMGTLRLRDTWATYVGCTSTRSFVRGDRGSTVSVDHLDIDVEGYGCDPEFSAVFDFTTSGEPGNPDGGFVRLRDIGFGDQPTDRPFIRLRTGDANAPLGVFVLEDSIFLKSACSALIETDGGWNGMDSACSLRGQSYPRLVDTSARGQGGGKGESKGRGVIRGEAGVGK